MTEEQLNSIYSDYVKEIRPIIEPLYRFVPDHHGIQHIDMVVLYGITIASQVCPDKINQVIIACALHDCGRLNDDYDLSHEKLAGSKVSSFLDLYSKVLGFTEQDKCDIYYAVTNHTSGYKTDNVVAQCLWDADRIRMALEYGYDESYFNTEIGKLLAKTKIENN